MGDEEQKRPPEPEPEPEPEAPSPESDNPWTEDWIEGSVPPKKRKPDEDLHKL